MKFCSVCPFSVCENRKMNNLNALFMHKSVFLLAFYVSIVRILHPGQPLLDVMCVKYQRVLQLLCDKGSTIAQGPRGGAQGPRRAQPLMPAER